MWRVETKASFHVRADPYVVWCGACNLGRTYLVLLVRGDRHDRVALVLDAHVLDHHGGALRDGEQQRAVEREGVQLDARALD